MYSIEMKSIPQNMECMGILKWLVFPLQTGYKVKFSKLGIEFASCEIGRNSKYNFAFTIDNEYSLQYIEVALFLLISIRNFYIALGTTWIILIWILILVIFAKA